MTSKPINPFFEPGAPPPTIPQLTMQTLLTYEPTNPPSILAGEELPTAQHFPARRHIVLFPSTKRKHCDDSSEISDSQLDSQLDSQSDSSESDDSSGEEKIPKPPGETSRPGRGGYNLEATLGWHPNDYAEVRKMVNRLIEQHLDTSRAYSNQSLSKLRTVINDALSAAPDLDNYKDHWPLTDMIKMRLKATSRKATIGKQAAQVAEAERAAKEILAGTETVVNGKKAKRSKKLKI